MNDVYMSLILPYHTVTELISVSLVILSCVGYLTGWVYSIKSCFHQNDLAFLFSQKLFPVTLLIYWNIFFSLNAERKIMCDFN